MSWTALMERDLKEHLRPGGRWSFELVSMVLSTVVMAVAGAFLTGAYMHNVAGIRGAPLAAGALGGGIVWAMALAVFTPVALGPDAVAGERERHTLPTLAAAPLSDAEIVWAKALAITLTTCGVAAAGTIAAWATTTLLVGVQGLLWGLLLVPAALLLTALPAFGYTCLAIAFSVRAKTVKAATQRFSLLIVATLVPSIILTFFIPFASPFATFAGVFVMVLALGVLLLVVGPFLAFTRFRRERLLAD